MTIGSRAVRWRLFFVAIRVPLAIADDIAHLSNVKESIDKMSASLKCDALPATDFLLSYKIDDGSAEDHPMKKKKESSVMVYKDDHHEIFNLSGVSWPPPLEDAKEIIDYYLMYPRVMELTYFIHTQYLHTAKNNINPVFRRRQLNQKGSLLERQGSESHH